MATSLNGERYEHHSRFGTVFISERCDFRGGVNVLVPKHLTEAELMSDVSEMVANHSLNIREQLFGGFQGYDCIRYTIYRK
jgi:hypothetical protein